MSTRHHPTAVDVDGGLCGDIDPCMASFPMISTGMGPVMTNDGDGYGNGFNCEPDNPAVYPDAPEICGDFIDTDCDGSIFGEIYSDECGLSTGG